MTRTVAFFTLLALVVPVAARAGVEVRRSSEGRVRISNETDEQRSRRLSNRMVEPPQADLLDRIAHHAAANNLDPKLVQAVVQAESGYNRLALSNKGAMGLMQLMPGTAAELAVTDPYDVEQNLSGGARYLRQLLDAYSGQAELALAAYNAGPGAVQRHAGVPPYAQTREYIQRVLTLWQGRAMNLANVRLRGPAVEWRQAPNGRMVLTNKH